ncbi:MAG: SDR family NAD(P)-dependent oxidoreductase [SAR324 cluster bacterium]|nr:SDR family NAD(P)-dependent oxidoreductase [SAR324 cluster bacterium]
MAKRKRQGIIAVTGASRGLGASSALELARRGFTVACLTRAGKGIEEVPVPKRLAPRIIAERCDVTDEHSVARALAAAAQRGGGLAGVLNNAGYHIRGPSAELATEDFEAVQRTNVTGVFVVAREAHPLLLANGGGMIVNMGSFFDRLGVPQNLAYAASKAAVGAITRCLAVEWAAQGITVINVAPGYIETNLNREFLSRPAVREYLLPRIPVGRLGTPREVARLVAALFEEKLHYMTGETIYMDCAQTIAH